MKNLLFLVCFSIFSFANERITPVPFTVVYNEEKAALGKRLFFDTILSSDNSTACVSCHNIPGSGTDNNKFSIGVSGEKSKFNTPTVLNAVFNISQFWDGRVKDLHEQALKPLFNPNEMGESVEQAIVRLKNSEYNEEFSKLYTDGLTKNNLAEVISEFEKALITPNSRFDQYLRGDDNALNEQEKRGYEAFKEQGCISCHNGVNIGGNMYQKIGIMIEYKHPTQDIETVNGRYNITKRERDRYVFKVPTLRNIALTAPYLHDGSAATLHDAIMDMREHQLGIFDESDEVKDIEMFLKTLTGQTPKILQE